MLPYERETGTEADPVFHLLFGASESVLSEAQVVVPRQAGRDSSNLSQEAGPVDLVEGVLAVHCQKASVVDGGLTSVGNPENQLRGMQVRCCGQHGFDCQASPDFSHCFFGAASETPVIQE